MFKLEDLLRNYKPRGQPGNSYLQKLLWGLGQTWIPVEQKLS